MKIRTGFVSNSSSSSFVIAVKKGTTKKDVISILKKGYEKPIRSFISDDMSYCYDVKNAIEEENKIRNENMTKEETYEFIVDFLADRMSWFVENSDEYSLEMNGWNILASSFGTEDCDALGVFLYSFTSIDTDILKVVPSLD